MDEIQVLLFADVHASDEFVLNQLAFDHRLRQLNQQIK